MYRYGLTLYRYIDADFKRYHTRYIDILLHLCIPHTMLLLFLSFLIQGKKTYKWINIGGLDIQPHPLHM